MQAELLTHYFLIFFILILADWIAKIFEALLVRPVKNTKIDSSISLKSEGLHIIGSTETESSLWKRIKFNPPYAAAYWSCLPIGSPHLSISISHASDANFSFDANWLR